jgi:hypothetical protein
LRLYNGILFALLAVGGLVIVALVLLFVFMLFGVIAIGNMIRSRPCKGYKG